MRPEEANRLWVGPMAGFAVLVTLAILVAGCGGGSEGEADDAPTTVVAAVDLTGVEVEMHQAPG